MSPLRERAFDEIATLSEEQLLFIMNILDGLKRVIHEENAPSKDPFFSSKNQRFIEDGVKALDAGKGVEHDLIEV